MRWIRPILYSCSILLGGTLIVALVFYRETKPFVDRFGNHASVIGLVISVVGFTLTVWAVLETLRVSREAKVAIQAEIKRSAQERRELLARLRLRVLADTCEQASLFASEARHAIRAQVWLRAAERSQDARLLTARLLSFSDLTAPERLRAIVEDLRAVASFIERNRLKKGASASGLPVDKIRPLDSLMDELEAIRSRLLHSLMEAPDVDRNRDE